MLTSAAGERQRMKLLPGLARAQCPAQDLHDIAAALRRFITEP